MVIENEAISFLILVSREINKNKFGETSYTSPKKYERGKVSQS
jgi:hypothetical protein